MGGGRQIIDTYTDLMYGMLVYNRTMGKINKEGTGSKKSYFCEEGSWKGLLKGDI